MKYFKWLALITALIGFAPVQAQQQVYPCLHSIGSNGANNCVDISNSNPLPVGASQSFTNITTNTDTVIKATPGTFVGMAVNTGGTGSTATVYDNTACSGTKIGTFSTAAQGVLNPINAAAATGICVTTAGAGAANITILWR